MNKSYTPLSRKTDLVVQSLENDLLVYNNQNNKAFCLNQTSAAVWNACDGFSTIEEITKKVSQQMNSPVTKQLVWLALEQLQKEDLLAKDNDFAIDFGGLSRREVIRKVGLTTMVALPVISALIAPSAAMAASACIQAGNPCTPATPDPCCPGLICEGTCNAPTGIPG